MQVRLVGSNKRTKVAITESSRWLPTLCPVRSHFISCTHSYRVSKVFSHLISHSEGADKLWSNSCRVIVDAQSSPQLSKLVADGALRHQRISWGVYVRCSHMNVVDIYLIAFLFILCNDKLFRCFLSIYLDIGSSRISGKWGAIISFQIRGPIQAMV